MPKFQRQIENSALAIRIVKRLSEQKIWLTDARRESVPCVVHPFVKQIQTAVLPAMENRKSAPYCPDILKSDAGMPAVPRTTVTTQWAWAI